MCLGTYLPVTGVQWNSETSASGVTLLAVTSEMGRQ